MHLKLKKNGRSHGRIKLVRSTNSLGEPDWFAHTERSKVHKDLHGMPMHAVTIRLLAKGYQYTLYYK